MPIYAYECEECGVRFDRRQKFSDKPVTRCPECSGRVRRLIQPPGIVFKGSGWYITDSRRSSSASVPPSKENTSTGEDTATPAARTKSSNQGDNAD